MSSHSPDWRERGVRIGDFIYVPPQVPHQEINASQDEPLSCIVVRSDQEPVVVNLDLPAVQDPAPSG
jgi:uncharacterized RmlC-like cupin family protein